MNEQPGEVISTYRGYEIVKLPDGGFTYRYPGQHNHYMAFNTAWSCHYAIDEFLQP